MESPDFSTLEDLGREVNCAKEAWSRYSVFISERDELASQDWLSMREKVGANVVLFACISSETPGDLTLSVLKWPTVRSSMHLNSMLKSNFRLLMH